VQRRLRFAILVLGSFPFYRFPASGAPSQTAKAAPKGHRTVSIPPSPSELDIQIKNRVNALEAAKQSNDSAAVKDACRSLAAAALRRTGQHFVAAGNFPQAEKIYTRSIDFQDSAATHLDLCMAYLLAEKPDDCLSETSKVILRDPQNAAAWRVQSKAYRAKNDFEHAKASLLQAEAFPDSPTEIPLVAIAPAKLSTAQRAELKSKQADLAKIIATALNDLGTPEAREGKFPLALDHFQEAERWYPSLPGLMRNIGLSADRVSDYHEVVRALRKVVAADSHDQLARIILGSAFFSTHAFGEAVQTFAPLGDAAFEEPGVAYAWADSLIRLNRFPEASALLDNLEQRPLTADTFILIAQARSQMGDYAHAVLSCQRALAVDPQILKAHYIAALALLREGHSSDAESELRSESQVDPGSVETQYNLAFVLLQQSRPQEAIPWLEKVVTQDPDHAQANYELGKQLLSDGKTEAAAKYLEAAARLTPQLAHVHYQLQAA